MVVLSGPVTDTSGDNGKVSKISFPKKIAPQPFFPVYPFQTVVGLELRVGNDVKKL